MKFITGRNIFEQILFHHSASFHATARPDLEEPATSQINRFGERS
jgi:hypothetical protein